ncbi:protein ASPARTIC PROTEASE IN GUARD CELL 2-like [Forsythia ovata]|uniref:Protein ASPARTIC PROTEASE IN GUARD CELL 2-like n=1 Tax=Forsythia ovata TaxID=205694 RepID=A0ABD1RJ28_9LAMI
MDRSKLKLDKALNIKPSICQNVFSTPKSLVHFFKISNCQNIKPSTIHHNCQNNLLLNEAVVGAMLLVAFQSLLLILFLLPKLTLSSTETPTASGHAIPYPAFEHFNVKETIAEETKIRNPNEYNELSADDHGEQQGKTWKLHLVHRDKLSFSWLNDHRRRFDARMKRDIKRVASLIHRLKTSGGGRARYEVEDFGSDVVSGMDQGSGEYFVRIGVGSPERSQYMVIDSGSDIVWVQCQPCTQCYHQSDPVFDPADSASFAGVSCSSSVCDRIENSGCHAGRCKYEVSYGDGSYTKGTLALETLTIGHTQVQNVAIGCGHMNRGMFTGAAGLLGLGGGSMSLVGQLGGQTGGAFSYCLVSRGTDSSGSLEFGRSVVTSRCCVGTATPKPAGPKFLLYRAFGSWGRWHAGPNSRGRFPTH